MQKHSPDPVNIKKRIPVVVDKSHLVTIGERLYTEKTSFIRELVNNAYDADATEVRVALDAEKVAVSDNGCGMDEQGLRGYFTIGGSDKKIVQQSPQFHRQRIGEFGIGKFAALSACKRFEIVTKRGHFHASLMFDKERWTRHEDWHVDVDTLPQDPTVKDGTTVILHALTTTFFPGSVRRYLSERTPIHAPNFAVFLNGERIGTESMAGRKIPISGLTPYGQISGDLVLRNDDRVRGPLGIAVAVKGVLVRYESFGLERSRKIGWTRLSGRVNADFLVLTSNRDDFVRDDDAFLFFTAFMETEVRKALRLVKEEADHKADLQASRVLKDALQRIGRAMRRRRGLFPEAVVPFGVPDQKETKGEDIHSAYAVGDAELVATGTELPKDIQDRLSSNSDKKKVRRSAIVGKKSVARTLTIANLDVAVRMEHLGVDDESCLSGGVIFVNLDHPLYQAARRDDSLLASHMSRIITKELALRTGITDPRQAFVLQSELLSDTLT